MRACRPVSTRHFASALRVWHVMTRHDRVLSSSELRIYAAQRILRYRDAFTSVHSRPRSRNLFWLPRSFHAGCRNLVAVTLLSRHVGILLTRLVVMEASQQSWNVNVRIRLPTVKTAENSPPESSPKLTESTRLTKWPKWQSMSLVAIRIEGCDGWVMSVSGGRRPTVGSPTERPTA